MHRSSPLKPVTMLVLAAGAVELPFLVTCVLVQLFRHCDHCRHEWLSWPILSGVAPWFIATFNLRLLPRDLSLFQLRCGWAAFTVCFIALTFIGSWRSTLWRQLLAASFALSTALAVLAFAAIAA